MNLLKLIKREILITVLSIIIIVSFFGALTYAYFMDVKETDINVINYGDVALTFCADATCGTTIENIGRIIGRDENNDPLFMYPMSQTEALNTVPYIFKLENTGSLKLDLTIKLDKELTPTLDPNYSGYTAANDSYIYTAIEEQGTSPSVKLYTELEEGNILMHISLNPAESKVFNLWTWLKEDVPNEVQGTYFIADISVQGEYKIFKGFNTIKGVNRPLLVAGMTPVKWTGEPGSYVESTTTENDPEWYDYTNKKWANAKTEDGSYWVWIPRYAYKITSGMHTGGSGVSGTIDIKFLRGTTNTTTDGTTIETSGYNYGVKDTSTNYFLHPVFQNNPSNGGWDSELTGIWVAKYEASVANTSDLCYTTASDANCNKNTLIPAFKPNVTSWRYIQIGNIYDVSFNLKSKSDYGWNGTSIDTHQMKNTEWGAVAYLAQSIYGANQEIWINNNSQYMTGCAGNSVSEATFAGCQNAYNTAIGVKASTTFNITGIYDMSGGIVEYTASYVNNEDTALTNGTSIINAAIKYKNIYTKGTTDTGVDNYEANKNIYGDAVYETSSTGTGTTSWNSDSSNKPYTTSPWFVHGGYYSNPTVSGLFSFNKGSGVSNNLYGFRVSAIISEF